MRIDRTSVQKRGGEQQLVASERVAAGDLLVEEAPVVSIPHQVRYAYGSYSWDLVDRILKDRELLQRYGRLKLHVTEFLMDPLDLAAEAQLVKVHKKSRQLVRNLFFSVGTNNIGVLDDLGSVVGYGLYDKLSRSDHSCRPNAHLAPGRTEPDQMSLVASQDIEAGQPVTWSYFRETEFLPQDYETRNMALVNLYRFVCRCPRCCAEMPPELKGSPRLLEHFDQLLYAQAVELATTPGGLQHAIDQSPMAVHRRQLEMQGKG